MRYLITFNESVSDNDIKEIDDIFHSLFDDLDIYKVSKEEFLKERQNFTFDYAINKGDHVIYTTIIKNPIVGTINAFSIDYESYMEKDDSYYIYAIYGGSEKAKETYRCYEEFKSKLIEFGYEIKSSTEEPSYWYQVETQPFHDFYLNIKIVI